VNKEQRIREIVYYDEEAAEGISEQITEAYHSGIFEEDGYHARTDREKLQ